MEYLDFEIEIAAAAEGSYAVRVLRSPAGEATGTMRLSLEDMQIGDRIDVLQAELLRSGTAGAAPAPPKALSVEQFGRELWAALFSGDVLVAFEVSRAQAKQREMGMRLKLRVAPPELAALPWEYLFDAGKGDYLSRYASTPLVRYVPLQKAIEPLAVKPPLRILAMVASPSDYPALDVEREKGRLESAVAKLTDAKVVELSWLKGQTPQDLLDELQNPPWHVFHFIGHGGFNAELGEGVVVFADEAGVSRQVTGRDLGLLLGDHDPLRLAVLNSCDSARGDSADVFSSTAAALVRRGTPAVVAMQYEITDQAAIEFSRYFYNSIAAGTPVDAAVARGPPWHGHRDPEHARMGHARCSSCARPMASSSTCRRRSPHRSSLFPCRPRSRNPSRAGARARAEATEPKPPEPKPAGAEAAASRSRRSRTRRAASQRRSRGGRGGWLVAIGAVVIGTLLFIGMMAILGNSLPGRIAYATELGNHDRRPGWVRSDAGGRDGTRRHGPRVGAGCIEPRLPQRIADSASRPSRTGPPGPAHRGQRLQPGVVSGRDDDRVRERSRGQPASDLPCAGGGGEPVPVRPAISGSRSTTPRGRRTAQRSCSPAGRASRTRAGRLRRGSGFTQLTFERVRRRGSAWSPDGQSIAFASTSSGNFDIWEMNSTEPS